MAIRRKATGISAPECPAGGTAAFPLIRARVSGGSAIARAAAQPAVNLRMSSDSVSGRGRRMGSARPRLQRTAEWVACGRRGTLKAGGQSMAGGPARRRTGGPNSLSKARGP